MSSIREDWKPRPPMQGWNLGFGWVAATSCGWAIGFGILPFLAPALFVILGLPIGSLQLPLLPKDERARLLWVLATTVGVFASFGFILWHPVFLHADPLEGEFLALALGGALLGTLQWIVLRRSFTGAAWWIPASAIGMIPSGWIAVGALILAKVDGSWSASSIGMGALAGAVHGTVTGLVWVKLRPRVAASEEGAGRSGPPPFSAPRASSSRTRSRP